jgi:hypothetical protein
MASNYYPHYHSGDCPAFKNAVDEGLISLRFGLPQLVIPKPVKYPNGTAMTVFNYEIYYCPFCGFKLRDPEHNGQ